MIRYLGRLTRAFSSPNLLGRGLNRLWHRRAGLHGYNRDGVEVLDEDWDSLVILDACRYDMFESLSELAGELEYRYSRGSSTVEFLRGNFHERELLDTVYVTANPQLYRNRDRINVKFHNTIDVWRQEGWDEDHQTVLPETMTDFAKRAIDDYPNKRLVFHYIQPHYPFLGSDETFDKGHLSETHPDKENVWGQLMTGTSNADPEQVKHLYYDNLERTLPHIEDLLNYADRKTVVTSDHGNMLGERARPLPIREWGHPRGIYTEGLVKVPWLVVESEIRPKIVAEQSTQNRDSVDQDVVAERLQNLGYAE